MPVKVLIPTPLRPYADHQDSVELEGANVGELLDNLTSRYGELRKHLFDESGQLRSFVNVYVNENDIRSLSRVDTCRRRIRRREHRAVDCRGFASSRGRRDLQP